MTSDSTWEDRMAARAAERAAREKAQAEAAEAAGRERRIAEGLPEPTSWPGHEAHHLHVRAGANYRTCSCGEDEPGCWTVADDARYWSDDPAQVAQAQREDDDFRAWVTCCYCGETGVTADDVLGVWPPGRLMTDKRSTYDLPVHDPRHRCAQGLCDDHAGAGGRDAENLRLLEPFFLPLSPQEAAERARVYSEAGVLTRDMIVRALGGEPTEGS